MHSTVADLDTSLDFCVCRLVSYDACVMAIERSDFLGVFYDSPGDYYAWLCSSRVIHDPVAMQNFFRNVPPGTIQIHPGPCTCRNSIALVPMHNDHHMSINETHLNTIETSLFAIWHHHGAHVAQASTDLPLHREAGFFVPESGTLSVQRLPAAAPRHRRRVPG